MKVDHRLLDDSTMKILAVERRLLPRTSAQDGRQETRACARSVLERMAQWRA